MCFPPRPGPATGMACLKACLLQSVFPPAGPSARGPRSLDHSEGWTHWLAGRPFEWAEVLPLSREPGPKTVWPLPSPHCREIRRRGGGWPPPSNPRPTTRGSTATPQFLVQVVGWGGTPCVRRPPHSAGGLPPPSAVGARVALFGKSAAVNACRGPDAPPQGRPPFGARGHARGQKHAFRYTCHTRYTLHICTLRFARGFT